MDPSTVQTVQSWSILAGPWIPTCEGAPEDWRPRDWSPEDCCRFREDALKPVVAKDVVVSSDAWQKCLNDKWCWVWLQSFWIVDFRVTSSRLIPRRNTFESAFYIFMIWNSGYYVLPQWRLYYENFLFHTRKYQPMTNREISQETLQSQI